MMPAIADQLIARAVEPYVRNLIALVGEAKALVAENADKIVDDGGVWSVNDPGYAKLNEIERALGAMLPPITGTFGVTHAPHRITSTADAL